MVLGIVNDYSIDVELDSELANPTSGVFANIGVNPLISIKNLLQFLPYDNLVYSNWSSTVDYSEFDGDKKNIVVYNDVLYQSKTDNKNSIPSNNSSDWLPTNEESLKLKQFLKSLEERANVDINLSRRLVDNQFLYDSTVSQRKQAYTPNGDLFGYAFANKRSDYTCLRINQISLEAKTAEAVNVYVINQGGVIETITLEPKNGKLVFEDVGYEFYGKGEIKVVTESREVMRGLGFIQPSAYSGFTVMAVSGINNNEEIDNSLEYDLGYEPNNIDWSYSNQGNGFGFNISVTMESGLFIKNHYKEIANYYRAVFEYMAFELFYSNNSRSNRESLRVDPNYLVSELKDLKNDTVARRREIEKNKFVKSMAKVFDKQLNSNPIKMRQGAL